MIKCKVCNRDINGQKGLGMHIKSHGFNAKTYYDTFFKQRNEGRCPICNNATSFHGIEYGYATFCPECVNVGRTHEVSEETKNKIRKTTIERYGAFFNPDKQKETCLERYGVENPFKNEEVKEKIKQTNLERYGVECVLQDPNKRNEAKAVLVRKQTKEKFEKENNCIEKSKLTEKYGYGWYQAKILTPIFMEDSHANISFYSIDDIPKIEKFIEETIHNNRSHIEMDLLRYVKSIYGGKIKHDCKSIISPKELDIYLPELKLAIEFNGTYWHSFEMGTPKEYHLEKSLLCREKGIRLIHIYEFEDFDTQLKLLKDLLNGVDNYPKNDFNKNNLLENIPNEEIIYHNNNCTIYGAGKLF